MKCHVVQGDLLDQDVDVIVNAWNRNIIPWWLLLAELSRTDGSRFRAIIGIGSLQNLRAWVIE
jgi:hypothetical protein